MNWVHKEAKTTGLGRISVSSSRFDTENEKIREPSEIRSLICWPNISLLRHCEHCNSVVKWKFLGLGQISRPIPSLGEGVTSTRTLTLTYQSASKIQGPANPTNPTLREVRPIYLWSIVGSREHGTSCGSAISSELYKVSLERLPTWGTIYHIDLIDFPVSNPGTRIPECRSRKKKILPSSPSQFKMR